MQKRRTERERENTAGVYIEACKWGRRGVQSEEEKEVVEEKKGEPGVLPPPAESIPPQCSAIAAHVYTYCGLSSLSLSLSVSLILYHSLSFSISASIIP